MKIARVMIALAVTALTAALGAVEAHAQPAAPLRGATSCWCMGRGRTAPAGPRDPAASGRRPESHRRAKSADVARGFLSPRHARIGASGWPDRAGRHSWGGTVISETGIDAKVSALVYVAARAPDAGRIFVALSGKFPTGPVRAGIQEHDGFTRLSEDSFLKYFANASSPRPAQSALCRAGTCGRRLVRRTNQRGRVALQALMVCGVETRSDHQSRPGAIPGETHECDHRGAGGRSPVSGVTSQRDCRSDPGGGWPQGIAVVAGCEFRFLAVIRVCKYKSAPKNRGGFSEASTLDASS